MKIDKIIIKNFRAFQSECTINLGGKNLLLYGENGSGKSSLFQALNLFFAPSSVISNYKNVFLNTDDGYIKLDIGDGANPTSTFEWEATTHPISETLISNTSKTKGFLDYRSLLETHFVHRDKPEVNIFNLVINALLKSVVNPISKTEFGIEWKEIITILETKGIRNKETRLNPKISDFNAGLAVTLNNLTSKANQILAIFDQNVTVQLSLHGQGPEFKKVTNTIENETILLETKYFQISVPDHHHFLNESRLSAISISIYLGALLLNPPSELRILFLDDVLIGLDISNRLPLLDVFARYFGNWQIILATYDKEWFDMAWPRLKIQNWKSDELYCRKTDRCDIPMNKGDGDYLAIAYRHLQVNDLKAAALYIRSAWESCIKNYSNEFHLKIPYDSNLKQESYLFWDTVKNDKRIRRLLTNELKHKIEIHRTYILNPLSHAAIQNIPRSEVETAFEDLNTLCGILDQVVRQAHSR